MIERSTIVDNQARELVAGTLEASTAEQADVQIRRLVGHVASRCAMPGVQEKYAAYSEASAVLAEYPVGPDGFVQSFEPLTEETAFYDHWSRYGVVVSKSAVNPVARQGAIARVHSAVSELSSGSCDLDKPETYDNLPLDAAGVPILTRGFFELYHDDALAQLRQSVGAYIHHVLIWGRHDLWTTFDRYGVKLPEHAESAALPLHVDQNPRIHPHFRTVQGVLALDDCPIERGTLVVAPGSKERFSEYGAMALGSGAYVELDTEQPVAGILQKYAQPMPIRAGDLASWDSRTTHANTANLSSRTRYIALVSAGPSRPQDAAAVTARAETFRTGIGSNVRDALMHASKKPRYENQEALHSIRRPEQLTALGRLVYGIEPYRS